MRDHRTPKHRAKVEERFLQLCKLLDHVSGELEEAIEEAWFCFLLTTEQKQDTLLVTDALRRRVSVLLNVLSSFQAGCFRERRRRCKDKEGR